MIHSLCCLYSHLISRGVLSLVLLCILSSRAAAQEGAVSCNGNLLTEAQRLYELGLFDDVIENLQPCLPEGFAEKDSRSRALRLMSLSHVGNDDLEQAASWVSVLLAEDNRYRVPDDDPVIIQNLVDELRPKRWHQKWVWRGVIAGTVALSTTAILVASDRDEPLIPLPPSPPGSNRE